MIRIKICGITAPEDAIMAAQLGADAVGLNFFSSSRRYVTPERAQRIAAAIPQSVNKVGVFVNASADEISRIAGDVPLDYIQLHGDEPPEALLELGKFPVIRAWRVSDQQSLDRLFDYLQRCQSLGIEPSAVLIDSYLAGQYGGTGEVLPWDLLVRRPAPLEHKQLILAGGLTAANISHAIHTVRPDGVDVASGVEDQSGRKSEPLVRAFIEQTVAAFAAVTAG